MSEIEIFYNTTLPVGDDIKGGQPCSIIHFNPKTYEVTGEEHYNLENVKVPDHAIESLARAFLPAIQDFYASEEGQKVKERLDRERAEKEALKKIEKHDKRRAAYHDYYCKTKWGKASSYDICVNSSLLGIDGTVDFLYDLVQKYMKK